MLNFLEHLAFWHWLGLAAILLIVEMLTGSGFLLWMGISAGLISLVLFLFPTLPWMVQAIGFAVLAIMTALCWWHYLRRHPLRTDRPILNQRGQQYVGRVFTLETPIVNNIGKVHVDDTYWRVLCEDLPAGARIRITGVDGVILRAKPE